MIVGDQGSRRRYHWQSGFHIASSIGSPSPKGISYFLQRGFPDFPTALIQTACHRVRRANSLKSHCQRRTMRLGGAAGVSVFGKAASENGSEVHWLVVLRSVALISRELVTSAP